MSQWKTVKAESLTDAEPVRKNGQHSFFSPAKMGWLSYCRYCGHVPLKNGISQLIGRLGCNYQNQAPYKQWVSSGRKPL